MSKKYREYKSFNPKEFAEEILKKWQNERIFEKSLEKTKSGRPFVFYEGPPSANGMPGIHHVMARAVKDIVCRYKTLKGFYVERKAGWDTHGLPVEIGVEKKLGITKDDIGNKISIEAYNRECRSDVMKYKAQWDELTQKMGYWVDLEHPYITFDNKYIESLWHLLSELYKKNLLYKGYTIQPYSPAAGTGLSTHELNQPGCYRNVKDNTVVAQFKIIKNEKSEFLFKKTDKPIYCLAWTTTPWTLPSNTGLAVGPQIKYSLVETYNQYTHQPIAVIAATVLLPTLFDLKNKDLPLSDYKPGDKKIPFKIVEEFWGKELQDIRYEQLLPYAQPTDGDPFRIVTADFVTTEDGTGIVHIAPSFGADDFKTNKIHHLGSLTLVDKKGRFTEEMGEFAGRYVKKEYEPVLTDTESVDIDIIVKLKKENKAFKTEKYEHSYPHCWRTDKPILYYPLDSWFIRTTALKERMIELNKQILWKPTSTGTGRFGNWLENLVDWNLSRSRYWGTPLPIWRTRDGSEEICIGSVGQLYEECEKSVKAGLMSKNPLEGFKPGDYSDENYNSIDLHRPYVDEIILISPKGQPMYREPDLIDVWFDSGAMPYAQFHFPFERSKDLSEFFPADFIAEGVDQTRGWFYTLHAIATMLFDSMAFKAVVSNGLVLDKEGNKMAKRLGNVVDPFDTIDKYGPDATRWYLVTNSNPWDNLKFDMNGIVEANRKFFSTLYNTYSFFALYANIDGFTYSEPDIPFDQRPELDRWILSSLQTLIKNVEENYDNYEITHAGRLIANFVIEDLSNWYVRLSRRRFWKGEYSKDKISAYQTLYTCLSTVAQLASPIAPFYMDRLFIDLNEVTGKLDAISVHLTDFPAYKEGWIDVDLEERMQLAQKVSSLILSLRKKTNNRVRQPLQKALIPAINNKTVSQINAVKDIILSETNVKELEVLPEDNSLIVKKVKPDFKQLGPRLGKLMKEVSARIGNLTQEEIKKLERQGKLLFTIDGQEIEIKVEECEILVEDMPGWEIASEGPFTVALDITITDDLKHEGYARDLVNRIQNLRKDNGFEVTDRIKVFILEHPELNKAIEKNLNYICSETLADEIQILKDKIPEMLTVEIADGISAEILVRKQEFGN
ncbi:MAG: isoleucine--tRNA ligase [Bacteroidota bacterium]